MYQSHLRVIPGIPNFDSSISGKSLQLVVDFRNTILDRIGDADIYILNRPFVIPTNERREDSFVDRIRRECELMYCPKIFDDIGDECESVERVKRPKEKHLSRKRHPTNELL